MGAKQFFTMGLAVCFAAVGVSANYMPDITHILDKQSGVVFEDAKDEYVPEAVVNRVAELDRIALPAYNGQEGAVIFAENNGYILRQGDNEISSYTFVTDDGEELTAATENGTLTFTNSYGAAVTNFDINYEHIVYDTYGDIHTPNGVLRRTSERPQEQSVEELVSLINKDTECFKALDEYISGGSLPDDYSTPNELVDEINALYLEIDGYMGYVNSYEDDEIKDKLKAVIEQLEEMTVTVNTSSPTQGGDVELNMNKLIILDSVLTNSLEQKGISVSQSGDDSSSPDDDDSDETTATTKKTTTTTKKKATTTTTKKTTKKKKTTTTTTAQQTQPQQTQVQTQAQTQAPATTTTQRPVVTVTTTTQPRYTVSEFSKTIYALNDGVFYEQPALTSTVRGNFQKYYNAACTGLTSNGYYRILIDGYTLYAPKSDFSEDPNTTVITTKAPTIKTGSINKYTKEMLTYINALRKEHGVAPLEGLELLDTAADIRAKELKTLFDHNRPDTSKYKTVYDQVGLSWHSIAENITYAMNTTYKVEDAFNNWKNSQGHLNNMLNPDFKYMAIGYYSYTDKSGNDFNYWEQLFYTP